MATNPGTANLVEWWDMEEASGNRTGEHAAKVLSDNATVTSTGGIVGDAANFERGNSEYLDRADEADLSFGNVGFSVGCWCKLESKGNLQALVTKWKNSTNDREYMLAVHSNNTIWWIISSDGTATNSIYSTGTLSTGTWYHIVAYHDAANDLMGIVLDSTTHWSTGYANGCNDNVASFIVGAKDEGADYHFDGLIDEASIWNDVLSTGEVDWLYNGGSGRTYTDFTVPFAGRIIWLG